MKLRKTKIVAHVPGTFCHETSAVAKTCVNFLILTEHIIKSFNTTWRFKSSDSLQGKNYIGSVPK